MWEREMTRALAQEEVAALTVLGRRERIPDRLQILQVMLGRLKALASVRLAGGGGAWSIRRAAIFPAGCSERE
jgi:hypothetical protein